MKIIIIDNDIRYRNLLKDYLEFHNDFEVVGSFSSCEEIVENINFSDPDIILVTINTHPINEADITIINQIYPDIKVIVLSGSRNTEFIINLFQMGANGFLLKTTPLEDIKRQLLEIENNGIPLSPDIARVVIDYLQQKNPKNLT